MPVKSDNIETTNKQTKIMEENSELDNLQTYINNQINILDEIVLINNSTYLIDNYIIGLFANFISLLEVIKKENRSLYESIEEDFNLSTESKIYNHLIGLSINQKIKRLNDFINLLSRIELKIIQTNLITRPVFREKIIIILITLTNISTTLINKFLSLN